MQKQTGMKKILVILIIALILLAAVILWMALRDKDNGRNSAGIVVSDESVEWNKDLEDTSGGQPGIKIPGYGDITVNSGSTTWEITLLNPEGNDCYFQYAITIDDSDTPIYESDLIEPGKAITEFEVSEPLEAGDYEIHLNISAFTMDESLTALNGADVKAVLHVI